MFCGNCGAEYKGKISFCPKCGYNLAANRQANENGTAAYQATPTDTLSVRKKVKKKKGLRALVILVVFLLLMIAAVFALWKSGVLSGKIAAITEKYNTDALGVTTEETEGAAEDEVNATPDYPDAETSTESIEENIGNGEVIFETEYEIVDYCAGVFLVSKSDGLLYGAVNSQNEEILPVEYDDISFVNSSKVIDGENENVYIQTEYEGKCAVYDVEGNKILDHSASTITYEMGTPTEDSPFFCAFQNGIDYVYNENGELLFSYISSEEHDNETGYYYYHVSDTRWINPNCFLSQAIEIIYDDTGVPTEHTQIVRVCEIDGDVIAEYDNAWFTKLDDIENENYWIYIGFGSDLMYQKLTIDADGNMSLDEEKITEDDLNSMYYNTINSKNSYTYTLGENNDLTIYTTNDTWKFIDADGKAVYDDRYYTMAHENNCYLLSNADNEVCIITQNGKKTVDYGYIEFSDPNYVFDGMYLSDDNCFADNNSVCIITSSDGIYSVHYFSSN